MNHVIELTHKFDASPRFSKDPEESFAPSKTATAIARSRPESIFGSAGASPTKSIFGVSAQGETVAAQLFSATAQAKIWTASVAMHLDRKVRDRLFRQLDSLHDTDEWVAGDTPVNLASYQSCVRAILYHHINSKPGLALMPSGNILALWQDGKDKLTVEFLPGNKTRWMVQTQSGSDVERAAGVASLERLRDVIQPYCASRWFSAS